MREYQHKRKIRNIGMSAWFLGALLFITLVLLSSVSGLYQKKKQVIKLSNESKQELQTVQEKTDRINKQLEVIGTDHGREQLIREKYNVKTEGEQVIVVMDAAKVDEGIPIIQSDFWYTIKNFFMKLFD